MHCSVLWSFSGAAEKSSKLCVILPVKVMVRMLSPSVLLPRYLVSQAFPKKVLKEILRFWLLLLLLLLLTWKNKAMGDACQRIKCRKMT